MSDQMTHSINATNLADILERVLDKDSKVLKIVKSPEGWAGEAEMYEESSFIKSLGLATKVQDRNIYEIKLTNDLEVMSYARKGAVIKEE